MLLSAAWLLIFNEFFPSHVLKVVFTVLSLVYNSLRFPFLKSFYIVIVNTFRRPNFLDTGQITYYISIFLLIKILAKNNLSKDIFRKIISKIISNFLKEFNWSRI